MASRNIAITEDVYLELERRKAVGESFTKVIKKLLRQKKKLSDFAGAWEDLTPEEEESIGRAREEFRANFERASD